MYFLYALLFCMVSCLCGTEALIWSSNCCLKKHPVKNHVKKVLDCKVQNAGPCPFDAIIIKTHKGRKLCYDLQEEWVVKNVAMSGTNACDVTLPKKNSRKGKKPGRGGKTGKRKGKQKKGRLN